MLSMALFTWEVNIIIGLTARVSQEAKVFRPSYFYACRRYKLLIHIMLIILSLELL